MSSRYLSSVNPITVSSSTVLSNPPANLVTMTGTGGYSVTMPDPTQNDGIRQSYYNNSTGAVTLLAPAGAVIKGLGTNNTSSMSILSGSTINFTSDGANYVLLSSENEPFYGDSGVFTSTFNANPINDNASIQPSGTGVITINSGSVGSLNNTAIGSTVHQPGTFTSLTATSDINLTTSGTISIEPTTLSSINNMSIGQSTAAAGTFTTLSVNSSVSGAGFDSLFASPYPIGSTAPNTGAVTSLTVNGTTTFRQTTEKIVAVASPGASTTQSFTNSSIFYFSGLTTNFTLNLTGVPTTANRTIIIQLILEQGTTSYYCSAFSIDGAAQTIKWPGGAAPTGLTPRTTGLQTFTLVRTSGNAWLVSSMLVAYNDALGTTAQSPAISAAAIKVANPKVTSGVYWLYSNSINGGTPFQCYCDFTMDGGIGYAVYQMQYFGTPADTGNGTGFVSGPNFTTMSSNSVIGTTGFNSTYAVYPNLMPTGYNNGAGATKFIIFSKGVDGSAAGGITSSTYWVYSRLTDISATNWTNIWKSFAAGGAYTARFATFASAGLRSGGSGTVYIAGTHGSSGGVYQWVANAATNANSYLVFEYKPVGQAENATYTDPNHYWMVDNGDSSSAYFRANSQYGNGVATGTAASGVLGTRYGGIAIY